MYSTSHQRRTDRRYWDRSRNTTTNNFHPPAPPLAPPIPASTQSKLRLRAFQFVRTAESEPAGRKIHMDPENDQENRCAVVDKSRLPLSQKPKPFSRHGSQKMADEFCSGEYPQTPAGRVPLADLISNGEDPFERAPPPTPMERVLWNHSPRSSGEGSSLVTPIIRRGRKRGHSSSPSSTSGRASHYFPASRTKPPSNEEVLESFLKTPQADPGDELWNRITANRTPTKHASTAAANFMHSSSPQTPANPTNGNDSNGLRRTASCGVEWPTSVAKRRKIQRTVSQAVQTSPIGDLQHHGGGESRVQQLMEQVHDGFSNLSHGLFPGTRSSLFIADPKTKPCALSQHGRVSTKSTSSDMDVAVMPTAEVFIQPILEDGPKRRDASTHVVDRDSSSEFGSVSFDSDVLDAIDATVEIPEQTVDEIAGTHMPSFVKAPAEALAQPGQVQLPSGQNNQISGEADVLDEFDEFDGDDIALSAADLEGVAALFDQRSTARPLEPLQQAKIFNNNPSIHRTIASSNPNRLGGELAPKEAKYIDVSSDDDFGEELSFEDFAEYERATQADLGESPRTNDRNNSTIQRFLIMRIGESQYNTDKGLTRLEKVLLVQDEQTKTSKAVTLRESWYDSPCTPGSYIHVLGKFNKAGQCTVDDSQNLLILHPDHLLSVTVVADSFSCTRRAVLQDRVKATNAASEPQVYGNILHEVFQEAMKANTWDTAWLTVTVETIARRHLETLFEINIEVERAVDNMMAKVSELQSWAEIFVTSKPKPDAVVKDRNGTHALMSINKLLDVEEHVWSPMYGLKGNIDATVQVVMKDGNVERTLTVPFEVKTGKNHSNVAHKAQTALYTLLLSDRYDLDIAYGILYYMETSEISRIPAVRLEILHMIKQRNELACYVRHRLELPPMLKKPYLCGRCYAKNPCFLYHKLVDNGDGETSGMNEKFDEIVKHIQPVHQDFFKRWDDLITKEETDVLKFRKELWTMLSSEREKAGRCFGNIRIEPGSDKELNNAQKINHFQYTFVKDKAVPSFSFADSQITVGEPIVISDEKGHFALANGYVTNVRQQRITVAVDRRLHNARVKAEDFDAVRNQSFTGIMEIGGNGHDKSTSVPRKPGEQVLYRLDKDEFSNGMATVRNNLMRMMENDLFGAQALRKLIIEGVAPTFIPRGLHNDPPMTASQADLNVDQRNAIRKVMSAKDYALVLGMPGTGKTTTTAHIIRALASQGKSILLASYTHSAVDNILLKIRNDGIGILRLGAVTKVHPEVQEFADLAGIPKTDVEDLKRSYGNQVVATTCLGINHPIFNQRVFDYCIVDEASQITLPVCVGPIRMARTFILVGDHYQLPPLVQNKDAREGGLDISLFKLLSAQHPSSVVNLEHQYRMCKDIMLLSNSLIYDGRLKCGTEAVASQSITIPNMGALEFHHHSSSTISSMTHVCPGPIRGTCWIRDLLDPAAKVVFLNTDLLLALSREIAKGQRIINPMEAAITTQIVKSLLTVGIAAANIGVITLYRSQLALLNQNLRACGGTNTSGNGAARDPSSAVEMHTADRFQGRDKEVIVLSLVRSNDASNVGDLLKDWRRVNVALTRARTKLIVIGSWDTIRKGNKLLARFCELIDEHGWRTDVQPNWMGAHLFEEPIAQPSARDARPEPDEAQAKVKKMDGIREPEKQGRLDVKTLLNSRPVMRDIINDVVS